jgi:hypothetical protein
MDIDAKDRLSTLAVALIAFRGNDEGSDETERDCTASAFAFGRLQDSRAP